MKTYDIHLRDSVMLAVKGGKRIDATRLEAESLDNASIGVRGGGCATVTFTPIRIYGWISGRTMCSWHEPMERTRLCVPLSNVKAIEEYEEE